MCLRLSDQQSGMFARGLNFLQLTNVEKVLYLGLADRPSSLSHPNHRLRQRRDETAPSA